MTATEPAYEGPVGYVFAVADRPYCCWEVDNERRTLDFVDGLDSGYFSSIARMLAEHLSSEEFGISASIALRAAYQQGIEALMSLLGAIVQAPHAVPAWVAKCTTSDLTEVVGRLADGRTLLTQIGPRQLTFEALSNWIHRFVWVDGSAENPTAQQFARLWQRLAAEMSDEITRAEYNAIKHGLRVNAGGFQFAIGAEETPGIPAPPEAMRSLGGSRYGSTFFVPEEVGTTRWDIRVRRTSVNWSAEAMAMRLSLLSMSITNACAALRCHLGADPTTQRFVRPTPPEAFDDAWAISVGVRHSGIDTVVRIGSEDQLSREDLKAILEQRGSESDGQR